MMRIVIAGGSKYNARKTVDPATGEVFDSKKEALRWLALNLLERAGEIRDLKRQVRYPLIPAQRDRQGKLLERGCDYVADFVYTDARTGEKIVEDAKGAKTDAYIIKRKLMLYVHGIRITET